MSYYMILINLKELKFTNQYYIACCALEYITLYKISSVGFILQKQIRNTTQNFNNHFLEIYFSCINVILYLHIRLHWPIQGGHQGRPPPRVSKILSFSCSFRQKNWKIIALLGVGAPLCIKMEQWKLFKMYKALSLNDPGYAIFSQTSNSWQWLFFKAIMFHHLDRLAFQIHFRSFLLHRLHLQFWKFTFNSNVNGISPKRKKKTLWVLTRCWHT